MGVVAPLLRLLLTQPVWLARQADAYATLGCERAVLGIQSLRRQAWLMALALLSGAVGVGLAGVAVMLWTLTAALPMAQPWALLAPPAVLLLLAALFYALARRQARVAVLEPLRQRWAQDVQQLQAVAPPSGHWGWVVVCAQLADTWLRERAAHPPAPAAAAAPVAPPPGPV